MGVSEIINLGNGSALVGTQGATNGVTIVDGTVAQAVGMTGGTGDPVAEFDNNPIPKGAYVINRGGTDVNFVVAGKRYNLATDRMQSLNPGPNDQIQFYREGESDLKTYKISEGTYEFKFEDNKWELNRKNFKVTIDNADNSTEFNYVVKNKSQLLAPGARQEHASTYPLIVRFDNGKGESSQKRLVNGAYRVALTDEGVIDLFKAPEVSEPIPVAELAKSAQVVDLFGNWGNEAKPRVKKTSPRGAKRIALRSYSNRAVRVSGGLAGVAIVVLRPHASEMESCMV